MYSVQFCCQPVTAVGGPSGCLSRHQAWVKGATVQTTPGAPPFGGGDRRAAFMLECGKLILYDATGTAVSALSVWLRAHRLSTFTFLVGSGNFLTATYRTDSATDISFLKALCVRVCVCLILHCVSNRFNSLGGKCKFILAVFRILRPS
jgi:hypothetical protein